MEALMHSEKTGSRAIRKKQKGLTLLETMAVLTILAFFMGGIFVWLQGSMTGSRTNSMMGQLAAVQSNIATMYGGQSTYTGLNTAAIADSDLLPAKMIGAGSTIKHAFKADLEVAAGATNDTYIITARDVPRDACQKIVTMDLGKNMVSLSTSDHAAGVSKQAYTPPNASAQACVSTDVDIIWEFY